MTDGAVPPIPPDDPPKPYDDPPKPYEPPPQAAPGAGTGVAADGTLPARPGGPGPGPEITEHERRAAIEQLKVGCQEGHLTLDEYSSRMEVALGASTRAELARVHDDLPMPAPPVGQRMAASNLTAILSDQKRVGRWRVPARMHVLCVMGDATLDLRDALTNSDEIHIDVRALMGDVKIYVPEGVEVELTGNTFLGDRKLDLAPVPRIPGTPLIVVDAVGVMADVKVRSLEPGESASAWRRFVDRLTN